MILLSAMMSINVKWPEAREVSLWLMGRQRMCSGLCVPFMLSTSHSLLVSVCSSLWQNVTVPRVCLYWENFTSGEGKPSVQSINAWEKQEKSVPVFFFFILAETSLQLIAYLYIFSSLDNFMDLAKAFPCLLPVALVLSQAAQISLTVSPWDFKCSKM